MELLNEYIDAALGGSPMPLILGLVFATTVCVVWGTATLVTSRSSVSRRLYRRVEHGSHGESGVSLRGQSGGQPFQRILQPLDRKVGDKDPEAYSATRRRLERAGYMGPSVVAGYHVVRVLLALGLPLIGLLVAPKVIVGLEPQKLLIGSAVLAVIGLRLPAAWISSRINQRRRAVEEALPDALDLMLVCVEAGLSLDSAIARVATEIGRAHPIMGEQLQLIGAELRVGQSRDQALRNFAQRTDSPDVKSLVTLLIQSETLGTSIAQALRVHADEMRAKRILRAEEKANTLPVKLSLPLVLFILPSLLSVLLVPGVIRVIRELFPALGAGTDGLQ
jgi:tight adherence protein C